MIANRLLQRWAAGEPTLNGWLSIGNPFTAEIMAEAGYDSLTVDLQHGALDYADLLPMLQALRASGVVPLARVPWLEPGIVMKVLDAGAYGVICPMVNTPDEAARLVRYVRYPPRGERSYGPTRAAIAAGSDYAAQANDQVLAFAMVETRSALDHLDAIAATEGLDGIYVGPADLTLSVAQGQLAPGMDREEPALTAALHRIVAACRANGIRAALHCGTPEYAVRAIGWGFDMVTVSGDTHLLATAAGTSVARFRELSRSGGAGGAPAA